MVFCEPEPGPDADPDPAPDPARDCVMVDVTVVVGGHTADEEKGAVPPPPGVGVDAPP